LKAAGTIGRVARLRGGQRRTNISRQIVVAAEIQRDTQKRAMRERCVITIRKYTGARRRRGGNVDCNNNNMAGARRGVETARGEKCRNY